MSFEEYLIAMMLPVLVRERHFISFKSITD